MPTKTKTKKANAAPEIRASTYTKNLAKDRDALRVALRKLSEQRDELLEQRDTARLESTRNDQIIQDVLAERDELLAALRDLLFWAPRATAPMRMDKMDTSAHFAAEETARAAIANATKETKGPS